MHTLPCHFPCAEDGTQGSAPPAELHVPPPPPSPTTYFLNHLLPIGLYVSPGYKYVRVYVPLVPSSHLTNAY